MKTLRADLKLAARQPIAKPQQALTAERATAAKKLEKLAEAQINDLAMKVRFAVDRHPERRPRTWTAHGWDTVEYRIATNAGEPLKPLDEIASGGEMSPRPAGPQSQRRRGRSEAEPEENPGPAHTRLR